MSFIDKIEALRKQPKPVRDRYAFGVATGVTALVAVIWAVSLPARLSIDDAEIADRDPNEPSLTEQLSELRNFVSESVDSIQTQAELVRSLELATTSTSTATLDYLIERASSSEMNIEPTEPATSSVASTSPAERQ